MTSDQFWRLVIVAAVGGSMPAIKSAIRSLIQRRTKRRG